MNRRLVFPAAATVLALFAVDLFAQPAGRGNRVAADFGWSFNYEQARAVARKTGQPLMVVFRCDP